MRCNLNHRQRVVYIVTGAALLAASWLVHGSLLRLPLAALGAVIAIEGFSGY
jgi:hypothetical protein